MGSGCTFQGAGCRFFAFNLQPATFNLHPKPEVTPAFQSCVGRTQLEPHIKYGFTRLNQATCNV